MLEANCFDVSNIFIIVFKYYTSEMKKVLDSFYERYCADAFQRARLLPRGGQSTLTCGPSSCVRLHTLPERGAVSLPSQTHTGETFFIYIYDRGHSSHNGCEFCSFAFYVQTDSSMK